LEILHRLALYSTIGRPETSNICKNKSNIGISII
jgi:hypothetical protein